MSTEIKPARKRVVIGGAVPNPRNFEARFRANQEPLGEPFSEVLWNNLDELYEREEYIRATRLAKWVALALGIAVLVVVALDIAYLKGWLS